MFQDQRVLSLAQPWSQPFLQGALGLCWKKLETEARVLTAAEAVPRLGLPSWSPAWSGSVCERSPGKTSVCTNPCAQSHLPPNSHPPGTSECDLIWNRVLEDMTEVGPESGWPYFSDCCPSSTRKGHTPHTWGEVMTEAEMAGMWPPPRDAGRPQTQEAEGRTLPWSLQRERDPATP